MDDTAYWRGANFAVSNNATTMKKKEYELRLGASLVDNERGALAVVGLRPDRDASGTVVLKPVQMPSSSVLPLGGSPQLKLAGRLLV